MCGIAGYVLSHPSGADPARLERMLGSIRRRGPDDEGLLLASRGDATCTAGHTDRTVPSVRSSTRSIHVLAGVVHDVAILHARYGVIDPSDAAHQPFSAAEDGVFVAFQGEIFNHIELREELETGGMRFRTRSDTEVLARALEAWGGEAWNRLNGIWAAAVYDPRTRRLTLSRDRLGIAPLYLARSDEGLFFGSSPLGVARACGAATWSGPQVRGFLETGLRDVGEETCIAGVTALAPGTSLTCEPGKGRPPARGTPFWEVPRGRWSPGEISIDEAATRLRATLESAVTLRLRSDLEVGFQLSGGLDSSSIVALASELSGEPLPTYTVSVPEHDEEPLTRLMADRVALHRTVVDGGAESLLDDGAGFAALMEEPVQSPAAFGHHRMCRRMKRDGFGVTLSGSGGDEVLAGYEWDFWPAARAVVRREAGPVEEWRHHLVLRLGSRARAAGTLGDWARRLGVGPKPDGGTAVGDGTPAVAERRRYAGLDFDERCRFHLRVADLPYYLASNDKATLGIPVEHRQPFLDHRVVELGLRMPVSYLFHRGWTKYVLRRAMSDRLPAEILWRRTKTGFPFPVTRLMRTGRSVFEPHRGRALDVLGISARSGYAELVATDPLRLWRECSVGLWLEHLD